MPRFLHYYKQLQSSKDCGRTPAVRSWPFIGADSALNSTSSPIVACCTWQPRCRVQRLPTTTRLSTIPCGCALCGTSTCGVNRCGVVSGVARLGWRLEIGALTALSTIVESSPISLHSNSTAKHVTAPQGNHEGQVCGRQGMTLCRRMHSRTHGLDNARGGGGVADPLGGGFEGCERTQEGAIQMHARPDHTTEQPIYLPHWSTGTHACLIYVLIFPSAVGKVTYPYFRISATESRVEHDAVRVHKIAHSGAAVPLPATPLVGFLMVALGQQHQFTENHLVRKNFFPPNPTKYMAPVRRP